MEEGGEARVVRLEEVIVLQAESLHAFLVISSRKIVEVVPVLALRDHVCDFKRLAVDGAKGLQRRSHNVSQQTAQRRVHRSAIHKTNPRGRKFIETATEDNG